MAYQLTYKGEKKGPVRKTHQTAMKDAVRMGYGRWSGKGNALRIRLFAEVAIAVVDEIE